MMRIEVEALLEPTLDVEFAPPMTPQEQLAHDLSPALATHPTRYWVAQGLVETLQGEFVQAQRSGDAGAMHGCFYRLAKYYTRTLAILRHACGERREPLTQAALHNFIILHRALHDMHVAAPLDVPAPLTLDRTVRARLLDDVIMQVMQDSARALDVPAIVRGANARDPLSRIGPVIVRRHLDTLVATDHLATTGGDRYTRTNRPYVTVNLNQAVLGALISPDVVGPLDSAGFRGLSDVIDRAREFRALFCSITGFADSTAALFVAASELAAVEQPSGRGGDPWPHADLAGSGYPRPYQFQAQAIFRGYGYQGQLIESPTGSGKTLIGMLCIEDWLRTLSVGQTILVLVPTVNYQQQWVGELCYKEVGLQLPPHLVFTGTPAGLEAARARHGITPCVVIMTYAALAQTGSGVGKGGFDRDSIEIFLQGNNVQYVLFDEVHKVVDDMHSVSADVTRLLVEWLRDGSIRGAIGFSGTAAPYRPRFAQLGLQLVYVMPAAELIAYGFVAPFAEFGVPFAYSDRERQVRELLDRYKAATREFIALIGVERLRTWFAAIPLEERIMLARDILKMYAGQRDCDTLLARRLTVWERGSTLTLTELPIVTLVQLAHGWSDSALIHHATEEDADQERAPRYAALRSELDAIRTALREHMHLPETTRLLTAEGFGDEFRAAVVRALPDARLSATARTQSVREEFARTIVGLYDSLSNWYLYAGEGRVATIKAIIEAERAGRPLRATIVFDAGTSIRWRDGIAMPRYAGVGGLFAEMLGDTRFTPMAALSGELYLPHTPADPLPARIAAFIRGTIMRGELGDALFGLATQGLGLREEQTGAIRRTLDDLLVQFIAGFRAAHRVRAGEFNRAVLVPFRKAVRGARLGGKGTQLLARLAAGQYHIRNWIGTFFDYAALVAAFEHPRIAELQQVSGARHQFAVIPMGAGARKQLMYDLTARIVDAPELPIDLIIVSSWARTGWNVISPNLLIDATATRDVTAWQQLRGRAMRALRTWDNACYRLVLLLLGNHGLDTQGDGILPDDVAIALEDLREESAAPGTLDVAARTVLREAHHVALHGHGEHSVTISTTLAKKIEQGIVSNFTQDEREQLVIELMLARNKVTHIYELVKAYGGRPQLHYDRTARVWERTESIAAKHAREYSVNPLNGVYSAGAGHAPLIYVEDPRKDVPSELSAKLAGIIGACDPVIVNGWLRGVAGDEEETDRTS